MYTLYSLEQRFLYSDTSFSDTATYHGETGETRVDEKNKTVARTNASDGGGLLVSIQDNKYF